jgi:hypothetical protein
MSISNTAQRADTGECFLRVWVQPPDRIEKMTSSLIPAGIAIRILQVAGGIPQPVALDNE